jgi:peptidoglycan/LPS O-acetylase OafA/YrhL
LRHEATVTYPALTGLRAALAALVVLLHARFFLNLGPFQTLISNGAYAVDVFFVLSGFILSHTYYDIFSTSVTPRTYAAFLQNRLARIYPVHLAMLIVGVAIYIASVRTFHKEPRDMGAMDTRSLIANLLLMQSWFKGYGSPNAPSWSISAEWFAYLFCPFVILLFRRINTLFLSIWMIVALYLPDILRYLPWHIDIGDMRTGGALGMASIVRITSAFSVGAIIYFIDRRFGIANRLPGWSASAFAIALIANFYIFDRGYAPLFLLLSAALILSLTAKGKSRLTGFLSSPRIVYLGAVSYSLYMCHWLVMQLVLHARNWHAGHSLFLWASVIVLSQITAILLYQLIEVPGRRLIRTGRILSQRVTA